MNTNTVAISLIMPVYNAGAYLSAAINSVLNQSFKNFELILVDDGSQDGSCEICDAYAERDSRIIVIHKNNGGICAARNTGLKRASGEYIGFLDHDDIIDSTLLEENYYLAHKCNADWVKFGKREYLIKEQTVLKITETSFRSEVLYKPETISSLFRLRTQSALTFVWDSLIRREVIEKYHLEFDTRFKYGNEDIDFCEILLTLVNTMVINSKCYYNHYTRLGYSTSTKFSNEAISLSLYLLQKSNARYDQYNLLTAANALDYITVVTRQIVVPICQKLCDAKKKLTVAQKKILLKRLRNAEDMQRYWRLDDSCLYKISFKLWIYRKLLAAEQYSMLLFFDKWSRKIIYRIRMIRSILRLQK